MNESKTPTNSKFKRPFSRYFGTKNTFEGNKIWWKLFFEDMLFEFLIGEKGKKNKKERKAYASVVLQVKPKF